MTIATIRRPLAVLIGFFIPISTALTNIFCPLALLLILAEGQYKQKFTMLRNNPIALLALLLFVVMLLGLFHTPVSWTEAVFMLDKYREFLYIPLFILIFRDSQKLGLYVFLTAMGVTLFLSYLVAITGWNIGKGTAENPFIFKNHITQGILMALAAYFVAVQCWQEKQWRWLRGIVVLLAIYNVVFMSEGRTGYVVLFCLIFLFCYQTYRLRGILVGSMVLVLLSTLIYTYSDILRHRISEVSENMQDYQQGDSGTSVGRRLEFYQNSLVLVAENPLLGAGTGSFSYRYEQLAAQQAIIPTTNPHNEYLMIAVQWGLLGVGLFIGLFYLMWRMTYYLQKQPALMAQGLIVTITVGCLVNSLWLDNTEGHLFAYLTGVFYGGIIFTYPPQLNLLKMLKTYLKQIVAIGIIIALVLFGYRATLILPVNIDNQLATVMLNNINTPPADAKKYSAIALDRQGNTTMVETKFNPIVKSKDSSGNNLVFSNTNNIEVSTQIQVDSRHVGKSAYIVIIASLQLPGETTSKFFQQSGYYWESLNINQLQSIQSYSYLPANIDLPIYRGFLVGMTGNVKVFVAYVLEDDTLILSMEPVQFRMTN